MYKYDWLYFVDIVHVIFFPVYSSISIYLLSGGHINCNLLVLIEHKLQH